MVHARDLRPNPTDRKLWTFAEEHSLVIVTKDADFTDRILLTDAPPPWVVQLRCGNLRARALLEFLERQWPQILILLPEHRLVLVHLDHIQALG